MESKEYSITIENKRIEIEAEMKRVGLWQDKPLPASSYEFKEAFGADTMNLSQWLQFVFMPRIKELIKTNGPWPEESEVGKYAAQQYLFFKPNEDDQSELLTEGSLDRKEAQLVALLSQFDDLFKKNKGEIVI